MALPVPTPELLQAGPFVLRILTADDWRLERELSMDEDVIRWTLFPPRLTDELARQRLVRLAEARAQALAARYALCEGADILGTAGISCTVDGTPELMYALLPDGRGRGAATAATRSLSDWALANGCPKVSLRTIAGNVLSEAVAERSGFRAKRNERQRQRGMLVKMRYWIRT